MKIDINGVKITLTKEQLNEIAKQTKSKEKYNHYTDIKSISDAIDYLDNKKLLANDELQIINTLYYEDNNDKIVNLLPVCFQLKLIARAINNLIDDTIFPNWKDTNQNKYYPYHEITNSGGLVFFVSYFHYCDSSGVVAFTKTITSSEYLGNQFINLYEQLLIEY